MGLGLSEENIKRLKKGKPISIDLGTLDRLYDGQQLMIFYGKTEQDMARALVPYISNETKVHRD